jgi:hypothetical protein
MPQIESIPSKAARRSEAAFLFKMAQNPRQSVTAMRELIASLPCATDSIARYRRDVLRYFDEFATAGSVVMPALKVPRKPSTKQPRRGRSPWKPRKRKLSDSEVLTANRALESGAHWRDVAVRFGVSKITLQRRCRHRKNRRVTT